MSESTTHDYLTTMEAAAYTRCAAGSLRNWKSAGLGPRTYKVGGKVLYRRCDLDAWITSNGSDAGAVA